MAYVHPENKLEIIDGSLRPVNSIPEDVVLVLERAHKGPANTVYLVSDMAVATQLYGADSPLIKLANRVRASQAENIALYRIGGGMYEYTNLFGPGSTLTLTQQSKDAADNIKVYVGPEPKSSKRQALIVYEGDRIIYSNVLGAEVNTSRVIVSGFNKATSTLRVGSYLNPAPFKGILDNAGLDGKTVGAAVTKDTVDGELWYKVAVSALVGFDPLKDDLSTVTLYKTGTNEKVGYTVSTDKTQLLINKYVDGVSEAIKDSDTLDANFVKKGDKQTLLDAGVVYTAGKDSMDATATELYEEYDKALENLDLIPTKALAVGDIFNLPNLASGSDDPDALQYLEKAEDENGYTKYNWSKHKIIYRKENTTDQETTDITEAELNLNGQPIIVKQYGEVDLVHRLGMFAYRKTEDGHFVNIVVGDKGPENTSPRAIANWVGRAPVRDYTGAIIENGTGLLGHRLMVGTTDYAGGYFATSNGFVDGPVLTDMTGFPIDLGKHLSIVVSQVASATDTQTTTSGAAGYAGLVSLLGPGQSTTNQAIPNLYLKVDIKESARRALAEAGYVVFVDKPKGLTVYSGDLATRDNSDYDYISTAITIAEVSKLITEVTDPFIGQGLDFITMTALNTALTTALANAQREGWFISYQFKLRMDGYNTLLVPYVIQAKDELRAVRNVLRLSRDTAFIEI